MAFFLFVFFFVASVSSKSLDLTKVNVDELSSDAQKPVFPGAPSDDADDEHFDEDDSDALEEEDGELPNEPTDTSVETNDEPSDETTPSESSEVTEATKEAPKCVDKPNCKSLAREGFCKMKFSDRIKKATCPVACNLCD